MQRHQYELRIPKAELFKALAAEYARWVVESKADDEASDIPRDELAEANYPPIEHVADDASLALQVLGDYLRDEVFGTFCSRASQEIVYWGDTVDTCFPDSECLVLRGGCYSKSREK